MSALLYYFLESQASQDLDNHCLDVQMYCYAQVLWKCEKCIYSDFGKLLSRNFLLKQRD